MDHAQLGIAGEIEVEVSRGSAGVKQHNRGASSELQHARLAGGQGSFTKCAIFFGPLADFDSMAPIFLATTLHILRWSPPRINCLSSSVNKLGCTDNYLCVREQSV